TSPIGVPVLVLALSAVGLRAVVSRIVRRALARRHCVHLPRVVAMVLQLAGLEPESHPCGRTGIQEPRLPTHVRCRVRTVYSMQRSITRPKGSFSSIGCE